MNTYGDNINITTNMENNRNCLRRIARHDETEFSNQSILNAMEKFVKSVNTMDETILVPCRLMDLKVGDDQDPSAKQTAVSANASANGKSKQNIGNLLNSADLFDVYNMLNNIKENLLWGQAQSADFEEESTPEVKPQPVKEQVQVQGQSQTHQKGHVRRPSTVSVSSTNSASSISDSDSEIGADGAENDSGIEESHQDVADRTAQVAHNFRRHLHGLTRSLKQLTDAAQYLTTRYQHDIGSPI
ncbi:mid1-interacting protein 1A [Atheta coriaria]|uniref:mid1-interacting protein 1A n=1 Tax=Dalotia coriaria TaxID=877792 RepID=UPI0031F38E71